MDIMSELGWLALGVLALVVILREREVRHEHGYPWQICEWMAPCPTCGSHDALVKVHGSMLYQGEEVVCGCCGHKGIVEVYGLEEVDVAWDELEESDDEQTRT